jgi:hypothetical protein
MNGNLAVIFRGKKSNSLMRLSPFLFYCSCPKNALQKLNVSANPEIRTSEHLERLHHASYHLQGSQDPLAGRMDAVFNSSRWKDL